MPLPTTFASASTRSEGEFLGSYGPPPIGGPYWINYFMDNGSGYASGADGSNVPSGSGISNTTNSTVAYDTPVSIKVDAAGNVYTGSQVTRGYSYTDLDFLVTKHDNSGNLLWQYAINNGYFPYQGIINTSNYANQLIEKSATGKIVIDSTGNVYAFCGQQGGSGGSNLPWLVKINSSGSEIWRISVSNFYATICVDSSNNLWIYESSRLTQINTSTGYGINYYQYTDTINGIPYPNDMIDDNQGNLVICGAVNSSGNGAIMSISKSTLNVNWSRYAFLGVNGPNSTYAKGTAFCLTKDTTGNIYCAGIYGVTDSNQGGNAVVNIAVVKYNNSGTYLDTFVIKENGYGSSLGVSTAYGNAYGGPTNKHVLGMAIDSAGNIFLAGGIEIMNTTMVPAQFKINFSTGIVQATYLGQNNLSALGGTVFYFANQLSSEFGTAMHDVALDSSGNSYWCGSVFTSYKYKDPSQKYATYFQHVVGMIIKDTNTFATSHTYNPSSNITISTTYNTAYLQPTYANSISSLLSANGGSFSGSGSGATGVDQGAASYFKNSSAASGYAPTSGASQRISASFTKVTI